MPPPPKRDLPPYVHQSGNNTYEYRISLPRRPDGTRPKPVRQGGYSDPYEAHRAAQAARRRLGAASPDEIEQAGITLLEWCTECMNRKRGVKPTTVRQSNYALETIERGRLAGVRIDRLRPLDLQAWLGEVADEYAPSTAQRAHSVINQAMRTAVKLQVLPTNPAQYVTVPKPEPRERVILPPADARKLLNTAKEDEDYALWLVLALMQLRPGEALALRNTDIDYKQHKLHVRRTLTSPLKGAPVMGDSAKSSTSHRALDMLQIVEDAMRAHQERAADRLRRGDHDPAFREQGLLFPNRYGGLLSHNTVNRRLKWLCQRAGVAELTGHELRHTGATWLRYLNVAPEVVARRLGHRNTKLVLDLYSNPLPDEQQRASRTLEQHLASTTETDPGYAVDTGR